MCAISRKSADAASQLLQDVFGKDKRPCRLVYGVGKLFLLGTPVELEVILRGGGLKKGTSPGTPEDLPHETASMEKLFADAMQAAFGSLPWLERRSRPLYQQERGE